MEHLESYLTLLIIGFFLIGMELFVPGGILGIFGTIAWIAAAVIGYTRFDPPWNLLSTIALLSTGILTFIIWIRYFPKSRIGRSLALTENAASFKAHTIGRDIALGARGKALSDLRPSGVARIDGKRVDVVADGEWIEAGSSIKVVSTSGGHISVVKIREPRNE